MNHPLLVLVITILIGSAALAQSSPPSLSVLTIQQAEQRMHVLEKEISDTLAAGPALAPKDMFESTADFNKRKQQWSVRQDRQVQNMRLALEQLKQQFYVDNSIRPSFVSYDADSQILVVQIPKDLRVTFGIRPAEAKEMHESWEQVRVSYRPRPLPDPKLGLDQASFDKINPGLVWRNQVYRGRRVPEIRQAPPEFNGVVYSVGNGVTAPVATYKVEPEYSEEARAAKYQGEVSLSIVVDEEGVPQNIKVTRGLGLGLDEKAIEAVAKWRFKPGTKDGRPVAVMGTVAMSFHLL